MKKNYSWRTDHETFISAEYVNMIELKDTINDHLTTWTEWTSCSPYCKRSRYRVCSGEFKCYNEADGISESVLCTGRSWGIIFNIKTDCLYWFLTYSVYFIWSTYEKITVRLNTKSVNGTRENASKNWEMIGYPLIQKKTSIMVVANWTIVQNFVTMSITIIS